MAGMRAMVLERPGSPLVLRERPVPTPGAGEILVRSRPAASAEPTCCGRRSSSPEIRRHCRWCRATRVVRDDRGARCRDQWCWRPGLRCAERVGVSNDEHACQGVRRRDDRHADDANSRHDAGRRRSADHSAHGAAAPRKCDRRCQAHSGKQIRRDWVSIRCRPQ